MYSLSNKVEVIKRKKEGYLFSHCTLWVASVHDTKSKSKKLKQRKKNLQKIRGEKIDF